MIGVFGEKPSQIPSKALETWKQLKPFDLKQALDSKLLGFNSSAEIGKFSDPNYTYNGQTIRIRLERSNGIGRAQGPWGLYEGQTQNGYLSTNVYGRAILRDGSSYLGYMSNGTFTGQGTYTSAVNRTYTGTWVNGNLTNS